MEKTTSRRLRVAGQGEISLMERVHGAVREAVEAAVLEELDAVLGAVRHERTPARSGYRNGVRTRTLTGPTGPTTITVPRARLKTVDGADEEWRPTVLPRYQRRMREVNEAIAAVYLCGGNTRRIRAALKPLLRDAPLSRSAVSRVVATLKADYDAWKHSSLAGLAVLFVYLDAIAVRVRVAGRVSSVPVLACVAVLSDGRKQLVNLEMCGSESHDAWKGFLDDLVARGLRTPLLAIVDGNAGLRGAVELVWPNARIQRCAVHKLRNLLRKAPKHAQAEIADDFHAIVYADTAVAARTAYEGFLRKWRKRCPAVAVSLEEGGEELLTFFRFPPAQWKTLRTTNTIERLNEELRRRVKTQGSFPTEDAALVLLYSLVASGQIRLRRLDGYDHLADVLLDDPRRPPQRATAVLQDDLKKPQPAKAL